MDGAGKVDAGKRKEGPGWSRTSEMTGLEMTERKVKETSRMELGTALGN